MAAAVLYDDDCNICKTIMDALLSWDRGRRRIRPVPIQSAEGQELLREMPSEKRLESFHLVRPGEPVLSGGPALTELFRLLPAGGAAARLLALSPRATAAGYDWVARNRTGLSRVVPARVKARASRRLDERLERGPS